MTMQTVLVLVGVPGSGKSTLAQELVAHSSSWTIINQDTLGDRKRCEVEFWNALEQGRDVIVDRCNHTHSQRETWVRLARDVTARRGRALQLLCLALEIPLEECKRRAVQRGGHATLSREDAPRVIDRFLSEFQPPAPREGFHAVHRASTPQQVHFILHTYLLPLRPGAVAAAAAAQPQQLAGMGPAQGMQQQQQLVGGGGAGGPYTWQPQPVWTNGSGSAAASWRAGSGGQSGAGWRSTSWQQPVASPSPQYQQQHGFSTAAVQAAAAQGPPGQPAGSSQPQWRQQRWRQQEEEQAPGSSQPPRPGSPRSPRRPGPIATSAKGTPGSSSNIVPFGQRSPMAGAGRESPGGGQRPRFLDDDSDPRPIVLWDLNGTLTSHTHERRSTGKNLPRPGTHHLRRLASRFRMGVFTSASKRTVQVAVAMLEEAAGVGPLLFDPKLVLHRVHTQPAPPEHIASGGKPWDTVKPLHRHFGRLHRVILMDDDSYKALPAEKANMVHVPCWQDEDPTDGMVPHFVEVLLQTFGTLAPDADVREHTAAASKKLHAVAARLEEERRQQQLGQGCEGGQQGVVAANGAAAPNGVLGDGAAAASNPEEIDIDIDC